MCHSCPNHPGEFGQKFTDGREHFSSSLAVQTDGKVTKSSDHTESSHTESNAIKVAFSTKICSIKVCTTLFHKAIKTNVSIIMYFVFKIQTYLGEEVEVSSSY